MLKIGGFGPPLLLIGVLISPVIFNNHIYTKYYLVEKHLLRAVI